MKEATSELNMTVIVVITIGLLSTFFFSVIWPRLNSNLKSNTKCSDAICKCESRNCSSSNDCEVMGENGVCKMVKCKLYDKKTGNESEIVCPYKG